MRIIFLLALLISVAGATGNAAACTAEFKCCTAGPKFCHEKHDNASFCDPSKPAQQQIGDGCSCPYGSNATAGKCTYFCKHDAKVNACGECSANEDCGGGQNACWALKDIECPHTQLPWAGATDNATACTAEFKCCMSGPKFCHDRHDNSSFCDPSTPAQRQIGDGCSCPSGSNATAGKCSAVPPPAPPAGYFCKHDAKGNACGNCSTDIDCGGEENACWASKDLDCPKNAHEILI